MQRSLKKFILSINFILIAALFVIIFIFTTYLHTSLAKKEAITQSKAVSEQVFASMYQVMKKGWNRDEMNDFTTSLKDTFQKSGYIINIYRSDKVNELFGEVEGEKKDEAIKQAFKDGKAVVISDSKQIRNIKPLVAKKECTKCHVNIEPGYTLGVIEIEQNLIDIIQETFLDYVYFILIIIPIFLLAAYMSSRYTTNKIEESIKKFHSTVDNINSIRDFKNFDTDKVDLHFDELNNIIDNVNLLAQRLKNVAVDKDLLEFEVQLLDKFIITSEVVKDWKEFVSELLYDINKIMETYTLMTMFKVGDDQFEIDIFWFGIPEENIKKELENYIKRSLKANDSGFKHLADMKIIHIVTNHNRCIGDALIDEMQYQTKSLFLDTPKIGGVVGISVQSDIIKDPIRGIVIDSILTTLANLVGSVKAIHKYTKDLEYYAAHDPLTGLFNQRIFTDLLEYEIGRAKRHGYKFSLLVIDCDNFKPINDRYGHAFGDKFLQAFAEILEETKRDDDILSRYGGDEFTIILPESDINNAVTSAQRIKDKLSTFSLETPDGGKVSITSSIGVSVYPDHASSAKELFMIADTMMYKAKEDGKNAVKIPKEDDVLSIVKEKKEKSAVLLKAVTNNNIIPFFQPIRHVEDEELIIHELLMRIKVDDKLLSAYEFIEIAENMSLISRMDLLVIENAFKKVKQDNYKGYLFINLSPKSLVIGDFIENVVSFIKKYDLDKSKIVFEITERETVKNFALLESFVNILKLEGFKFAIDDFGSGFSSFHYIKKFPIDFLKIDGEFIININKDRKDKAFVQSIITLAKQLDVKTVAEFVEDEEVSKTLKEMGIDFLQGFHIGKPSENFS